MSLCRSYFLYFGLFSAFGLTFGATASAAEVDFDGFYRARLRLYDTLSLDRDLANNEGLSSYVQHRLWLKPRFIITDKVSVFAEIRGLDGVSWGDEPATETDIVTGEAIPIEFRDDLHAPVGEDAPLLDFTLWRAWARLDTKIGRFSFGRMPIHWGMGVWQNDGLDIQSDYGDTVDRVSWSKQFGQVATELAVDVNAEGLIGEEDDTMSFNASGAYKTEKVTTGLQVQYRRTPIRQFNLVTVDAAFDAEIGMLNVQAEVLGQFGSGVLTEGAASSTILGVGAALDAQIDTSILGAGLSAGLATGDGDEADGRFRTFTFDRDYSVGLVMFEQPLPTLAAAAANETNNGRSLESALSGNALSNALYIRPSIHRKFFKEKLTIEAAVVAARTAKMPERFQTRKSYGVEIDLGARYRPFDHFELAATFGAFVPGSYYSEYQDDTYSGFSATVYAGQITGHVSF